ncbi:hypothetical protein K435DRAFT_803633 [Dendrothele bispora CBS 962.96]|uniref:Uncharacterized protein n=1 Tax=Dendrothele bispora (strain CBS 962.96) TaxID=1314807 RepID=A0A4V4HDQ9_DENBC|nr:hypothetical protein K435DRAFT_803633 [Dendrothele bispora CBS 962.96]
MSDDEPFEVVADRTSTFSKQVTQRARETKDPEARAALYQEVAEYYLDSEHLQDPGYLAAYYRRLAKILPHPDDNRPITPPPILDNMENKQDSEYEDWAETEEFDELLSSEPEILSPPTTTKTKNNKKTTSKAKKVGTTNGKGKGKGNKKEKSVERVEEKEDDDELNVFTLIIPRPNKASDSLDITDKDTRFDEVLDDIYEILGCREVKKKPELTYKLEGARVKDSPMSFQEERHWNKCVRDVLSKQKQKKSSVKVYIGVSPEYMEALKKWQDKKKKQVKKNSGGSAIKKSIQLDSDNDDEKGNDDESDGEDPDMMEKEAKYIALLRTKYSNCGRCKPKPCKIGRGRHISLTFQHLSAWAHCLAIKTNGVTDEIPPNTEQFSAFHASAEQINNTALSDTPAPSGSSTPVPADMMQYIAPIFGAFAAVSQLSRPAAPQTPTPTVVQRQPRSPEIPSSDGFDDTMFNPYPTISDFLSVLDTMEPERNFSLYTDTFRNLHFFHIDELLKLDQNTLTSTIGMSLGNALFLLDKVQKKVKDIKRGQKQLKRKRDDDVFT